MSVSWLRPFGADDHAAAGKELPGHFDRRVKQSARVTAEIQHQAFEVAFELQVFDRLPDFLRGSPREPLQPYISDPLIDIVGIRNVFHLDFLPDQHKFERLRFILPLHLDRDFGTGISAREIAHFVGLLRGNRNPANLKQDIARKNSLALCGITVHHADNTHGPVTHANGDPDPAVLAVGQQVHFIAVLFVYVDGIGVKRAQHPVNPGFHEFLRIDLIHVIGSNFLVYSSEEINALIDLQKQVRIGLHHKAAGKKCKQHNADDHKLFFQHAAASLSPSSVDSPA